LPANAAYDVTGKYIEENSCNDFELDSSEWDSVFYAFLSFTGGADSFDKINKNKARKFWTWYLDEAIKKAYSKDILVKNKPNKENVQNEINRKKNEQLSSNEIMAVINDITNILNNKSGVELKVYCVANTRMLRIIDSETKENINIDFDMHDVTNKVKLLKDKIYNINKDEGTFYVFKLKITQEGKKEIEYIYDTWDKEFERFSENDFMEDYKLYPRGNKYIPKWLKKIIKNSVRPYFA
jgi:hypothetical protein